MLRNRLTSGTLPVNSVPCKKAAQHIGLLLCLCGAGGFLPLTGAAQTQPHVLESAGRKPVVQENRAASEQVVAAIRQGRWSEARQIASRHPGSLTQKLYQWSYFTKNAGPASYADISRFLQTNRHWPAQGRLVIAAEKAMPADLPPGQVIQWFAEFPPKTPDAMDRYVAALLVTEQTSRAQAVLREWWKTATLEPAQQDRFLARYGKHIDTQSHVARFGNLLMNENYTNARKIARVLGRGYPELAEARIALAVGQGGVDGALARVPAHLRDDPGLMLERLRWRRKRDMDFAAIEILHNMPSMAIIPNPGDWWRERHILARRLLEKKQYQSAYLLVKSHGQATGVPFAEAEFLSGWLALRFLNKPWEAFEHFEKLYHGTSTPISRSRGAYWAGKASAALGHKDVAREWFQTAAQYQTAFYGQLAIGELEQQHKPRQQMPPEKTPGGMQAFERKDMVIAARLFHKAGLRTEVRQFLNALSDEVQTPEEYRLVTELAEELNQRGAAVRIAKNGLGKGVLSLNQAFPTVLSYMKPVNTEWALVHAVIRQESSFEDDATSHAGARGLMQLMPATAQEVARKHKIPFSQANLVTDPAKNVRMGSLYMDELLRRYNGSYALAIAAYNAGPGRVDRWVKENGDPRSGEIDLIDWIELIPIGETRNYVQRVLEGVYVYRQKLKGVQKSAQASIHVVNNGSF